MLSIGLLIVNFWMCYPSFLYGLAFLLGLFCHFYPFYQLIVPCLTLWIPFFFVSIFHNIQFLKYLFLSLLTFFTAWSTAAIHYSKPFEENINHSCENGKSHLVVVGKGHLKIKNICLKQSIFGERWLYRCQLKNFFPENSTQPIIYSLPCLISFPADPLKRESRLANQDYWINGKLISKLNGTYELKVSSKSPWLPIKGSKNWSEKRYQLKRKICEWIYSQFSHTITALFLAGLVTGEFDDYWMKEQFARFGLQHLLAISGFHFAIMATFLNFVLRLFFSRFSGAFILLACVTCYCFFLGPQPSILRAWIMAILPLLGILIKKQTTAFNSLGFALLAILAYNPLFCCELGFQLSFAITAAILLFYQPFQTWLYEILPKRSLSEVVQMNSWNQHGYCLLAFLRQGLALTLAVNVFALPLTLYYFHQFPLMGLLFNLFVPFLASISLCLLLLGAIFTWIPLIGRIIHTINDIYTFSFLQLIYQFPKEADIYWKVDLSSPAWLILYMSVTTILGILWREKNLQKFQEQKFLFL